MEMEQIDKLADLMERRGLTRVRLEEGDGSAVELECQPAPVATASVAPAAAAAPAPAVVMPAPTPGNAGAQPPAPDPDDSTTAVTSFMSFMASMTHRVSPLCTLEPARTKGSAPGEGAA